MKSIIFELIEKNKKIADSVQLIRKYLKILYLMNYQREFMKMK